MSRGATVRLFVAVDPPERVCTELAGWTREAAAELRRAAPGHAADWLRPLTAAQLHVTVCFLGSRPVAEIDALGETLAACAGHGCELSCGAPVWLPPRRPRALAVEIRDVDGELGRLREQLVRELAAVSGWEPERRRFRAHLTVARVRGGSRVRRVRRPRGRAPERADLPLLESVTPPLRFAPGTISLYRSFLEPEGARYEALASCALVPPGL
jgi:2'-5' RNA ligase